MAGDAVKNLAQVKTGDVVTAAYTEALVYEVKKGGKAGAETAVAGGTAASGKKPAGAIGQQTTLTVTIAAIDPKVPSVTFKGPAGNTRTLKVLHPERLQGVSVGDTVEITYTEALAIKVDGEEVGRVRKGDVTCYRNSCPVTGGCCCSEARSRFCSASWRSRTRASPSVASCSISQRSRSWTGS